MKASLHSPNHDRVDCGRLRRRPDLRRMARILVSSRHHVPQAGAPPRSPGGRGIAASGRRGIAVVRQARHRSPQAGAATQSPGRHGNAASGRSPIASLQGGAPSQSPGRPATQLQAVPHRKPSGRRAVGLLDGTNRGDRAAVPGRRVDALGSCGCGRDFAYLFLVARPRAQPPPYPLHLAGRCRAVIRSRSRLRQQAARQTLAFGNVMVADASLGGPRACWGSI